MPLRPKTAAILLSIALLFSATSAFAAFIDGARGVNNPGKISDVSITKEGSDIYANISGVLTNQGQKKYHDAALTHRSMTFHYGKLKDKTTDITRLDLDSSDADGTVDGMLWKYCTVDDMHGYTFTCKSYALAGEGVYVFMLALTSISQEQITINDRFLVDQTTIGKGATGTTPDKLDTQKVGNETYQIVTPIFITSDSLDPEARPQVKVTNPEDGGYYTIMLGTTTDGGKTCLFQWPGSSENLVYDGKVKNGVGIVTDIFPRSGKFAAGTYCTGLRKSGPSSNGNEKTVVASFGSAGSFTIGSNDLPGDGTTKPPSDITNAYGCTSGSSTSTYCMLAPIPIPDSTGKIDETGKIDTKQGFSNYIGGIIKLIMGLIGVLAVLMIVVGGIEYMSTVSIGEKEGAKTRITNAIFGLVLAVGSYVIMNTISPSLVNLTVVVPGAEIPLGEEAAPITESDGKIPDTLPPPTGGTVTVPSGDAKTLAQQILANTKITFQADQQGDQRSSPQQNIKDTAQGLAGWTSNRSPVGGKQVTLSAKMLAGMIAVSQASSTPLSISEILGGKHSGDSRHYLGVAFDVSARATDLGRVKAMGQACKLAGATELLGPCDVYPEKGVTGACKVTGFNTRSDHWNHVHCGWPR